MDAKKKTRPSQYGTGFVQLSRAHHVCRLSPSLAREAAVFAMYLLCVLRDNLCLTPVMGCAHMDDHPACRVTSVQTLSTTTKRTENNKCSAVTYVDGQAQTLLTRGPIPPPWRLSALPTQRTLGSVTLSSTVRTHPSRSTSAVTSPPKPDMFGSPHEPKTIWTESNYTSN